MKILPIEYSDIIGIGKELKNSKALAVEGNVIKELLNHLNGGLALKLVSNDIVVGVWFSIEFEKHNSLSFFYLYPESRNTILGVKFFCACYRKLNHSKPILLKAGNVEGFDKRVIYLGDDIYQFVWNKKWVA